MSKTDDYLYLIGKVLIQTNVANPQVMKLFEQQLEKIKNGSDTGTKDKRRKKDN